MKTGDVKDLLHSGDWSLVIENHGVRTFSGRGVKDLLRVLEEEPQVLNGAKIADKVVGKAAAALMVLGKVREVYAELISTPAVELLRKYGVAVSFGNETDHIMNRDETGWCPMETACRNVDSPTDMLRAIKEKMAEMMNGKQTVIDMKDYIEEKGLRFIFDTDVEEKLINCDKAEIERCIINLVSNAVKFTPKGGLIEVIVSDLDDKVKISVKDNGIGISEENKRLIFDRFNQVVDKNAESKGGSGLGLTICKQLITLHGGDIYVESEVGIGSEFIIILPVSCD